MADPKNSAPPPMADPKNSAPPPMADPKKLLSAQKNTTFFRGKIFLSRYGYWCYDAKKAVFNLKYLAGFWYTAVMW
jgi:hypothetical protein